jgi:hypothetical protein
LKACVILYHKNINKLYKTEWIEQCLNSILNQTYKNFYVYELNYGGDNINFSIYLSHLGDKYKYFSQSLENHAEAMNYLLDQCKKDRFSVVFNTNLDDYYHPQRFEMQIQKLKEGYDVVSSNMQYISENEPGKVFEFHKFQDNIKSQLDSENIIVHPVVCFGKRFISKVRYNPEEIPEEDYRLWKRICDEYKFHIINENLCYYRRHNKQISKSPEVVENKKTFILPTNNTKIEFCRCGGVVSMVTSPNGNRYKICNSCKKMY